MHPRAADSSENWGPTNVPLPFHFSASFHAKTKKKKFLDTMTNNKQRESSKQHLKSLKVWKDKCEIMKTKLCEVVERNAVCGPFKCFLYVWWNGAENFSRPVFFENKANTNCCGDNSKQFRLVFVCVNNFQLCQKDFLRKWEEFVLPSPPSSMFISKKSSEFFLKFNSPHSSANWFTR